MTRRAPLGLCLLALFFGFGAFMCALTIVLLVFPGTGLDIAWRLNPQAHRSFQSLGPLSILLMAAVGGTCGAAAIGLFRGARWGRLLGLLILSANLVGDAANAILRHDYRPLIGIPVGGAMIVYLWSTTCRKV